MVYFRVHTIRERLNYIVNDLFLLNPPKMNQKMLFAISIKNIKNIENREKISVIF
ncbi:hypothetical protein PUN28_012796 [Cardiocondyla obscurior]|uniref:Uncharacterized protein n=1 Tax=Cardiocondyla obscurior TaxID=286306 RepID=A0AAW2F6A5_9HYME